MTNDSDEIELILGLVVIGAGFIVVGVRNMLTARRVQDTATNLIAYAAQGNSEIEGYAWYLEKPLRNIAGTICAYTKYTYEILRKNGKSSEWVKQWDYEPVKNFVVMDRSGLVAIDVTNSNLTIRERKVKWIATDQEEFIELHNSGSLKEVKVGFFSGGYRIIEEYIPLGSPCYVQGNLDGAYRSKADLNKAFEFQEYVTQKNYGKVHNNNLLDLDQNGKVTHIEARDYMYTHAQNILENNDSNFVPNNKNANKLHGLMSTTESHKLIVADMHEYHFIKNISSMNVLKIILGAGMISTAVFILFN